MKKGQVAVEYILLLGGVIVIVALVTVFMQDIIFKPQKATVENQTKEFKSLVQQLQSPTPQATQTTPTSKGCADGACRPTPTSTSTVPCAQAGGTCVNPGPAYSGLPGSVCSNNGQPVPRGDCDVGSAQICCTTP